MSRSDWRYIAAVGFVASACLAFATLIGWHLQPKKPELLPDSYQTISASYRAGGASCDPSRLNSLTGGQRERKADACEEAQEQHREAANGLIEARRSADAANAATIAAYQQTGIAAWGTGLGIVTMLAAIFAALFAERAAHHTKRSADIARDASVADHRAWISFKVTDIKIGFADDKVLIEVDGKYANIGRLPATRVFAVHALDMHGVAHKLPDLTEALVNAQTRLNDIPTSVGETAFPGDDNRLHVISADEGCADKMRIYASQKTPVWLTIAVRLSYRSGDTIHHTDQYFRVGGERWVAGEPATKGLDVSLYSQPRIFNAITGGTIT